MDLNNWINRRLNTKEAQPLKKAELSFVPSTKDLLNVQMQLNKALKEKDWEHIESGHTPELADSVNIQEQQGKYPLGTDFNEIINAKADYDSTNDTDGVSVKTIHNTPNGTFMIKPFFDGVGRYVNPFSGFSIMTAKDVYDAAGLNKLIEDVTSGTHKETPITVHKFHNDYETAKILKKLTDDTAIAPPPEDNQDITAPVTDEDEVEAASDDDVALAQLTELDDLYNNPDNVNPVQAKQIGIMDYLLGNNDRHAGNLLVNKTKNHQGFKDLVAIDHDRLFEYDWTDFKSLFEGSAQSRALGVGIHKSEDHDLEIVSWWEKSKVDIMKALHNNVKNINDPKEKTFINDNFHKRFELIDKWTKDFRTAQKNMKIKPPLGVLHNSAELLYKDRISDAKMEELNSQLPKDPTNAIAVLSDLMSDEDYWPEGHDDAVSHTYEAIRERLSKSEPDAILRLISRQYSHKGANKIKERVLREIYTHSDENMKHIQAILKMDDSLPEGQKVVKPFWYHYASKLAKGA